MLNVKYSHNLIMKFCALTILVILQPSMKYNLQIFTSFYPIFQDIPIKVEIVYFCKYDLDKTFFG